MFAFTLAERLGFRSVRELKQHMSNKEYELWKVFYEIRHIKEEEAMKEAEREAKRR